MLDDSIVAGGAPFQIEVTADSHLRANRNVFDVGSIRMGAKAYASQEFPPLQQATGQHRHSQWKSLEATDVLNVTDRLQIEGRPVGADLRAIPDIKAVRP